MRTMRWWRGPVAALVAMAFFAPAARGAQPDPSKTPATVEAGISAECRRLGVEPCSSVDGRTISRSEVDAYERSWVHQALTRQRRLDDAVPFTEQLIPSTHNSFNSSSYDPTLTNQDPNQVYGLTDQLRMDIRGIELDLHWVPSVPGDAGYPGHAVVLCHGQPVPGDGPVNVHAGCSVDRPFRDGLQELRDWLDANPSEVVLLYLENNMDADADAHADAAATIESVLGELVARPPAGDPCADMPMATSRAALRAAGTRVLIVGNCGPGAWGTWVHERGPKWDESGSADYPVPADCDAERAALHYGTNFIRRYEDSTWLSAMAGAGSHLTAEQVGEMVRCGVNLPGLDQLTPTDDRLAAMVWSWAQGEPRAGAGGCATQGADGRFRAGDCTRPHRFACALADGSWAVTRARGPWSRGATTCAKELPGSTFAVPANGWRNELLRRAHAATGDDVWLAYSSADW